MISNENTDKLIYYINTINKTKCFEKSISNSDRYNECHKLRALFEAGMILKFRDRSGIFGPPVLFGLEILSPFSGSFFFRAGFSFQLSKCTWNYLMTISTSKRAWNPSSFRARVSTILKFDDVPGSNPAKNGHGSIRARFEIAQLYKCMFNNGIEI